MPRAPGLSIEFSETDLKQFDRAMKRAPEVLARNIDKANRSAAFAIQRDAIKNLSRSRLSGVDTGDLKRSVTVRKVDTALHVVGVPTRMKHGRFLETGTGIFAKAPKSSGRVKSNIPNLPRGFIIPRRAKFLRFVVRASGSRKRRVRRPIPGNKTFVKREAGKRIIFTKKVRGTPPRFWLYRAALTNQDTHTDMIRRGIAATLAETAKK